uniref:Uncharacterized protein n=1 Tax=Aegilops tauschii subsp. strangulata TaxID=200361 RepID=A0A453QA15_AEGTS
MIFICINQLYPYSKTELSVTFQTSNSVSSLPSLFVQDFSNSE